MTKKEKGDNVELKMVLPDGEKLKGNKVLNAWLAAVVTACEYQGIDVVVMVNGEAYKVQTGLLKVVEWPK